MISREVLSDIKNALAMIENPPPEQTELARVAEKKLARVFVKKMIQEIERCWKEHPDLETSEDDD